jgi:hypothetical protein
VDRPGHQIQPSGFDDTFASGDDGGPRDASISSRVVRGLYAVRRDMERDPDHGHADRCGGYRQQNLQRRLRAAEPARSGIEVP